MSAALASAKPWTGPSQKNIVSIGPTLLMVTAGRRLGGRAQISSTRAPGGLELLVHARLGEHPQRGRAGRHGQRVARERAGLVDGASGATVSMISRRPPKAPTGRPPPMILPSVVRSGMTS